MVRYVPTAILNSFTAAVRLANGVSSPVIRQNAVFGEPRKAAYVWGRQELAGRDSLLPIREQAIRRATSPRFWQRVLFGCPS